MKQFPSFPLPRIVILGFIALLVLGIGRTASAVTPVNDGRLIINRSPLLGRNVSITIKIAGKLAETLTWRRTFERSLTPGRHVITAIPSRTGTYWQGTLEVRPNETYSYTASYAVDKLVLERQNSSR